MAFVNTTSKIRVYINGKDYTDFLVGGSISDDSAYSASIITSKGSIVLTGKAILDFNQTRFPIGAGVNIYATLDNGKMARLARGSLIVLNSSINIDASETTLELGCSLAYLMSREASYLNEIKQLITSFISNDTKNSFIIDDYNLSTLQTLLDIDGKVIYQDSFGRIQSVNHFGSDSQGSGLKSAKLTCFDKASAIAIDGLGGSIEDMPSEIIVKTNVEVPTLKKPEVEGEDPSTPEQPPIPPPFINSILTRGISVPDALKLNKYGKNATQYGYSSSYEYHASTFSIENLPDSGEAGTEAVAGCGTIDQPSKGGASPYAYTVLGECLGVEYEALEKITQGRYISYNGPGNQVDFEYDFEYCSAATYASDLIGGVVDIYINSTNDEIDKSKSMLGKANQTFALRDDYAGRTVTPIYDYGFGGRLDETLRYSPEDQATMAAVEYYGCAANQYFLAGQEILRQAELNLANQAIKFADDKTGEYGYSRMQQTRYFYGRGDAVVAKVQYNYVHTASSAAAKKALRAISVSYKDYTTVKVVGTVRMALDSDGSLFEGFRFNTADNVDFTNFRVSGKTFDSVIAGDQLITEHDEVKMRNPTRFFNLVCISKRTTRYDYGSNYITETELFEDFDNPSNSYNRVNYSSASGPEEPDRIEFQRDGAEGLYTNDDSLFETENKEITSSAKIDIANKLSGTVNPSGWLGRPNRQPKEVSFPFSFAPIRTKIQNGVEVLPDTSAKLNEYSKTLEKYAKSVAKKITGDIFGYRITERGTRAEIYGYYPFYPITLWLSSLNKSLKLRAGSSNTVFDTENVLCSFDCFTVGTTSVLPVGGLTRSIDGTNYVGFAKTETPFDITNTYFKLPETAASIEITSLPATGILSSSGNTVNVGDSITIAQINANNLTFTPSSAGTVVVEIGYKVFTSAGDPITSTYGLYPSVQFDVLTHLFGDAGEFDNGTTNGGYDADGGDFDSGSRPGGGFSLNAGNFDTGVTVEVGEPPLPSSVLTGNNSVDPETQSGVSVVDVNNTSISTDTLPTPKGDLSPNFEVIADLRFTPSIYLKIAAETTPQLGWNYYYVTAPLGTAIDMGTISNPNNYVMNFGTISSPVEPVLASSVV